MRFPEIADAAEQRRLQGLVAQQPGEPFDRDLVRQSIRTVHATGRFADVRVEAERMPDGRIVLNFITTPNYFIGQVNVDGGPSVPTANQVINSSKLQLGDLFTTDKLDRGLKNIQQLMEENGFYRSTVQVEEQRHPDTQQIDFLLHVGPGPQAKIGQVSITGKPGYSEGQIQDIAGMHVGEPVSQQRVTNALSRLRKKYQGRDRWLTQVTITKALYRAETNAVDYTIDIEPGPTVQIQTEGLKISQRQLRKSVPVYEENALDDDLLNEGRRNLLNYLQTRGYFDAKVALRRRGVRSETMTVVYVIDPGAVHKVVKVQLGGEKYFPEEQLRSMMQVQPAGRFLSHGRYSQSLLNSDVRSLQGLYENNGFQQTKITTNVQDDENQLIVNVHIEEGTQTLVGAFQIIGATSAPSDVLQNLNTGPGQPFSDARIAEDREILLTSYFNRGFPDATFEASAAHSPGHPDRRDVTFTVHEGQQIFIDRVLVSGLNYTRPFVVQRELQVKPGDSLNQIDMLRTQQGLYDLGIFGQVDTAIQNPTGREKAKNVLVQVKEAKRYTLNYGVGLEFQTGQPTPGSNPQGQTGVSPRGSFSVTRLNFRGRDHTLTFKTNVGRLQQRALVSSDVPNWFNSKDWKLTITSFYDKTVDVSTFTSQRIEGSLQAQQNISKSSTMVYSFTYRLVKALNIEKSISPDQIPLLSQPVRVGIPSFSYIRDRRDNPLESTKGNYTTVDGGVASTYFGSEADFGRLLIQNSTYHAFGKKRLQERKWVFARSIRIGLENPFGNTITLQPGEALTPGAQAVPLPERFLSGGGNSHRGFGLNQAGPRDPVTGFPLGGSGLFVNNLELRFPPVTLPFVRDNMSFALFHDAGNVFTNANDMLHSLLRWRQRDPQLCQQDGTQTSCNYNYVSQAIGVGVRYKTPIGPVRFDFGYNLSPPMFPSCQGAPFTTGQQVSTYCSDNSAKDPTTNLPTLPYFRPQQARRFNVSFSIGQTF